LYLRIASSGWDESDFDVYLGLVEVEKKTELELAGQYMQTMPERAPGAVVAVWREGKVIFQSARGVADVETGTPLNFDSVFPVPFLDQQFLTFGLLELIRTGELRWDQKVSEILPWFPKFGSSITVDHLYHRRTGLRSSRDLAQLVQGDGLARPTGEEMRQIFLNQTELNFAPGSDLDFDNSNNWILQAVIAQAGKKPFDEWMQEHVFQKLGMSSAVYLQAGGSTPGLVHSYKFDQKGRTENESPNYPFSFPALSMNDWLCWIQFLHHKDSEGSSWISKREADQTAWFLKFPSHGDWGHFFSKPRTDRWKLYLWNYEGQKKPRVTYEFSSLLINPQKWSLELEGYLGRYGGRARETRQVAEKALLPLQGVYESAELGLRLEIVFDGSNLQLLHPKARGAILEPSIEKRILLNVSDDYGADVRKQYFQSIRFEDRQDNQFQSIRLSNYGYQNVLFKRIQPPNIHK
jgi:CubicO group peptidase (beta-lactamase class C family)